MLNVFLISADDIKAQELNYNVSESVIASSIRVAQEVYLRDVIGTELLEKLKTLVYNAIKGLPDTIDEPQNEVYSKLLDYIHNVLVYKVCEEICVRISYKIRNIGISQDSDTNVYPADLNEVVYLKDTFSTYFNDALNRMEEYLQGSEIPELPKKACGEKNKYGRTRLWLGGD